MNWKPEGYNSVSPYLVVNDASKVINFLFAVFSATVTRRYNDLDGSIVHAELLIHDSIIMIADATAEWPAVRAMVHVYVPDVDAVYNRAISAGATNLILPVQDDDPDKRGGFTDPAGNSWWIATQQRDGI